MPDSLAPHRSVRARRLRWLPLVAVLAAPLTAAGAVAEREAADPFARDRIAPPLDTISWHTARAGDPAAGQEVRQVVSSGGFTPRQPNGHGYPAWYGFPVLLLSLPEGADPGVLAFVELVQRANADRGLVVATVSRGPESAPAGNTEGSGTSGTDVVTAGTEQETGAAEFTPPSPTLLAGRAPESSPWCPDGLPRAIVLGPTGEVVGMARLMAGEKELLELLADALQRYPAKPLDVDVPDAALGAQGLYFAGEWDAARRAAEKELKKLARQGDPAATEAVTALVQKVDEHERALRAALVDASQAPYRSEELATIVAAIQRGFPRTKAAEEAKLVADAQRKDFARQMGYEVAEAWVAALPDRPVLFPEVADARGKKYARTIEAMMKKVNFDGDLTRRAKDLLLRYELAQKR